MFKNVIKEINSLFKGFNKLKLHWKILILAIIMFIGCCCFRSRILGFSFQNSLNVMEGFGTKSLTYYRMEGCPHCEKFDSVWAEIKSNNNTTVTIRNPVDSNDPECVTNDIKGFPTILLTDSNNKKIKECPTRDMGEMKNFCKDNE